MPPVKNITLLVIGCLLLAIPWLLSITKLLDVAKPLELWSVNDFHQQWMELNVAMDGIMKQLCGHDHISVYSLVRAM